jgi:hypothetical protein
MPALVRRAGLTRHIFAGDALGLQVGDCERVNKAGVGDDDAR